MLAYFGEVEATPCGECDLCLMRKHKKNIEDKIEQEIRVLLMEGDKDLKQLVDSITVGNDKIKLKILRLLIDEKKVELSNSTYIWRAN